MIMETNEEVCQFNEYLGANVYDRGGTLTSANRVSNCYPGVEQYLG